jgi:hypothetical protein
MSDPLLALSEWKKLRLQYNEAREAYRVAWAIAYSSSTAKTDALKKAEADKVTSKERIVRDKLEVDVVVAWQEWLHERGPCDADCPRG